MACGKTTIGKIVAQKMGYKFIDTDSEIEKRCGMTISDLFNLKGEEFFRQLESGLVDEISLLKKTVISCGGGIVKNEENIKKLKNNGVVIYLKCDIDALWDRIRGDGSRPLALGKSKYEIKKMMEEREPLYSTAHCSVDVSSRSPLIAAREVIASYNIFKNVKK